MNFIKQLFCKHEDTEFNRKLIYKKRGRFSKVYGRINYVCIKCERTTHIDELIKEFG